jgi:hypothetical protein
LRSRPNYASIASAGDGNGTYQYPALYLLNNAGTAITAIPLTLNPSTDQGDLQNVAPVTVATAPSGVTFHQIS